MPTYIGFSTKNVAQPRNVTGLGVDGGVGSVVQQPRLGKKFKLVDTQLVLQDLLNAFSIKKGDKVGQPQYGTTLWTYVFDPNTADLRQQIDAEIRRVIATDPRITLGTLQLFSQENGILAEMEISISPYNNVVPFGFFLNRFDGSIQQMAQ